MYQPLLDATFCLLCFVTLGLSVVFRSLMNDLHALDEALRHPTAPIGFNVGNRLPDLEFLALDTGHTVSGAQLLPAHRNLTALLFVRPSDFVGPSASRLLQRIANRAHSDTSGGLYVVCRDSRDHCRTMRRSLGTVTPREILLDVDGHLAGKFEAARRLAVVYLDDAGYIRKRGSEVIPSELEHVGELQGRY